MAERDFFLLILKDILVQWLSGQGRQENTKGCILNQWFIKVDKKDKHFARLSQNKTLA